MSIEVRVDGILLKPSDWHLDSSAGPLGIAFDFPLPFGARIDVFDTGAPPKLTVFPPSRTWRYGDMGRRKSQKGFEFMYIRPGANNWHEVVLMSPALQGGSKAWVGAEDMDRIEEEA